ncbi:hypothetical protein [Loigolactobacillus binensis]|uniref:HTH merR-type domain-containing protein n=1 Tax=Loigolactobacillus binensis TaxID=2559922 RepID=A0ABW3EA40_9LACO|nr:hypothetical protein [Loigolactobacillus binensis]
MANQQLSQQTGIPPAQLALYQRTILPQLTLMNEAQVVTLIKFMAEMQTAGVDLAALKHYAQLQNEKQQLLAAQAALLKQTLTQLAEKRHDLQAELAHVKQLQRGTDFSEAELRQLER